MIQDKLPPHDESAEWSLLACAVLKPSIIPAIQSELFYVEQCRRVLLKMQHAWLEKMQCLQTPEQFEHFLSKSLKPDQFNPLAEYVTKVPTAQGWGYWRNVMADAHKARCLEQLKPKITEVSERVSRGESPNEVIVEISRIAKLWQTNRARTIGELTPKILEELETMWKSDRLPGVITGFGPFDRLIGGLQPTRLYVIAARPSQGKSSLAVNMALGAAHRGEACFVVSLEMSAEEIGMRLMSMESRVSDKRFLEKKATDADFSAVNAGLQRLSKLPLKIEDSVRSLSDIALACHYAVAEGAKVIVIDYLQKIIIPGFRQNRNELVTQICNTLKDIAMTLRVPVICCAQLNRESEKQEREPIMADLRDSGSIEQDADFVGLLHPKKGTEVELIVTKNRGGQKGRIILEFRAEIFRFDPSL